MHADVLIVYASKHGSTEQVARGIGEKLRGAGLTTQIERADEVDDLTGFRSVLVGGSIYMGRWHRDARGFAKHFQDDLRHIPVAVFALGPTDDVPKHRAGSEKQLREAIRKLQLETLASAVFGGVVDPRKLHFPFNYMEAVDVRDWDEIQAWANQVAERFLSVPAAVQKTWMDRQVGSPH